MKFFAVLLLIASSAVIAEDTYITIPGEGWSLKLDTPAITSSKSEVEGRILKYVGSSVETGVTLSVNTELEASKNNQQCFDVFWAKAQKNPMMVKSSINIFIDEKAMYATHRSEGEYKGQPFKTANGHAYFAYNGICVDLHVSHWPLSDKSDEIVKTIILSAAIVK